MTTNTEIKTWQERIADSGDVFLPDNAAKSAEIAELRAALEAKQQALEAAQRAVSGKAAGYIATMSHGPGELVFNQSRLMPEKRDAEICAIQWRKQYPTLHISVVTLYPTPPAAVQPDSGRDAAKENPAIEVFKVHIDASGFPDATQKLQHLIEGDYVLCIRPVLGFNYDCIHPMAAHQGKQAPSAKVTPDPLRDAVAAFIKARGRFHAEQSYKALVEAFNKYYDRASRTSRAATRRNQP